MTYNEFLERLAQTPRDWRLTIRRDAGREWADASGTCWQCPLMACAGVFHLETEVMANELGLPAHVAYRIACVADKIGPERPKIRADLLRACGLTEK